MKHIAGLTAALALFAGAAHAEPGDPVSYGTSTPFHIDDQWVFFGCCAWNAEVTQLEIANAFPGGQVSWYGEIAGTVADDGTFSLTTPVGVANDIAGRLYGVIRVGPAWPRGPTQTRPFDVLSYTISGTEPPPAPEPAEWSLLISGFALTGTALRRKRSPAAVPSARELHVQA